MTKAKQPPRKVEKLWTPANVVTVIRICLVPVFVAVFLTSWPAWFGFDFISEQTKGLIAAALFVLISCTDWIDGYLARSRNEVTDFGKFLDPLADKILVAAALIVLVELQMIPSWPVLIILAREFIVSGVRMIAASRGEVIAASWYGKFKTVFQIIAIVLFIVKYSIQFDTLEQALGSPLFVLSWLVMFIALALTILSMLDYLSKARHLIGFKPKRGSEPTPTVLDMREDLSERAHEVVESLTSRSLTLATAESLTGGLIGAALTAVPGCSQVLSGGAVTYVDAAKRDLLGVDEDSLSLDGAVSESVVLQMAQGARERFGVDYALSASGIAGPDGGEPGKPVGTVWIALVGPGVQKACLLQLKGDREMIRLQAAEQALSLLVAELGESTEA